MTKKLEKQKRRIYDHARALLLSTDSNFDKALALLLNAVVEYRAIRKALEESNQTPK